MYVYYRVQSVNVCVQRVCEQWRVRVKCEWREQLCAIYLYKPRALRGPGGGNNITIWPVWATAKTSSNTSYYKTIAQHKPWCVCSFSHLHRNNHNVAHATCRLHIVTAEITLNRHATHIHMFAWRCEISSSLISYFCREIMLRLFRISVNLQFDMIDYNT